MDQTTDPLKEHAVKTLIQIDLAKAMPRPLGEPAPSRRLPARAPRIRRRWVPPGRR